MHTAGDGVRLTELAPAFLQKMAVFRGLVVKLLAEPHTFGGEVVMGGFVLSKVMSRVCEKVNERGKDIVPCRWVKYIGSYFVGRACRRDMAALLWWSRRQPAQGISNQSVHSG